MTNPADGQVFAEVAGGTAADVDAAVASAQRAFPEWSSLAVSKRGEILGKAAHHVEQHVDELVPAAHRASRARRCATRGSRSRRRSTR